jgi:hypothetical protein
MIVLYGIGGLNFYESFDSSVTSLDAYSAHDIVSVINLNVPEM